MKGLDPAAVRGKAGQISTQLASLDHLISELSRTHKAALNPGAYGIDPGERTIAPWSVGSVLAARNELVAARAGANELLARIHQEVGSQVAASASGAALGAALGGVVGRGAGAVDRAPEVVLSGFHMGAGGGGGAGTSGPSQAELDEMVEMLEALAWGSPTDEQLEAIAEFMAKYGDDEAAMSALFEALGGHDTALLIFALGNAVNNDPNRSEADEAYNQQLLAVAQALREGLATASEHWDADQVNAFLDSTSLDPREDLTSSNGLAYLFSDPTHPLGEALTLELAQRIDEFERSADADTLAAIAEYSNNPGYQLSWLENPAEGGRSVEDLAGRVFETLGQYPDSAMDFLSASGDATESDARLTYWFGDRDWSGGDMFEGPTALWEGAQHASGGPLDPDGTDPVAAQAQAEITSRVMELLVGNTNFGKENLSEQSAAAIALATSVYLPGITEYLWSNDAGTPLSDGAVAQQIHGSDVTLITPTVTEETLAELFGEAGAHQAGAQQYEVAIAGYQELYMAMAMNDTSLLLGSLERYAILQGALDGSTAGADLGAAARADAESDAGIEIIESGFALIPFPMISKIYPLAFQGVSTFVDAGQRLVITEGRSDMFDAWKDAVHTYDSIAAQTQPEQERQTYALKMSVAAITYAAVGAENGIPAPPVQHEREPNSSYVNRLDDWYVDYSPALEVAAGMDPGRIGNIATIPYGRTYGDSSNEAEG
jgi:hypothetical protein